MVRHSEEVKFTHSAGRGETLHTHFDSSSLKNKSDGKGKSVDSTEIPHTRLPSVSEVLACTVKAFERDL